VAWTIRQIVIGNLVPRITVDREREIARSWKEIAETYRENDRKRDEILVRNNEILARMLPILERAPWVVTVPPAGSPGFGGSSGSRHRQIES
jgi:hypothetical protein